MAASVRGDVEKKELKAQWPAETTLMEYTLKEVTQHATKDDLWIIIHGKVYNVTKYLEEHPGGAESLKEVAGTDATTAFEDVGHSEDAREIMAPYLQGVLKDAKATTRPQAVKVVRRGQATEVEKSSSSGVLKTGVTVAFVLGGAAGLIYGFQNGLPKMNLRLTLPKNLPSLNLLKGENGFLKGFILASALSGAIGATMASTITSAVAIDAGLQGYPPHKKFSPPTEHYTTGFLISNVYQSLPLVQKEVLGKGLVRLTFELPTPTTVLGLPIGQHVAIKASVGDQMVSRSYTPTSNNHDLGKLILVMRIYSDGLLTGGFIDKLNVGDEVDFRGPKGAMRYRKGWAKKIGMIAGGTGITPMYQLIRAICEDEKDTTEISLVYANRSEDDILMRPEMERFARQYPKNLKIWYMLDKYSADWKFGKGYITKDVLSERMPAPSSDSSTKVLLCGPPGMVNGSKKNLIELGWKAPGAVSKMSDDIFCF